MDDSVVLYQNGLNDGTSRKPPLFSTYVPLTARGRLRTARMDADPAWLYAVTIIQCLLALQTSFTSPPAHQSPSLSALMVEPKINGAFF